MFAVHVAAFGYSFVGGGVTLLAVSQVNSTRNHNQQNKRKLPALPICMSSWISSELGNGNIKQK
jgi:hypothetical protein